MAGPFHFEYAAQRERINAQDTRSTSIECHNHQNAETELEAEAADRPLTSSTLWSLKTLFLATILPLVLLFLVSMIQVLIQTSSLSHDGLPLSNILTDWKPSFTQLLPYLHHPHRHQSYPPNLQPFSSHHYHHPSLRPNLHLLFEPIDPSLINHTLLAQALDKTHSHSSTHDNDTDPDLLASAFDTLHSRTISLTHLILTALPCALSHSLPLSSSIQQIHALTTNLSTSLLDHQTTYFDPPSHFFRNEIIAAQRTRDASKIARGSLVWFTLRHLIVIPYWPALLEIEVRSMEDERRYGEAFRVAEAHEHGRELMVEARGKVEAFAVDLDELGKMVGGQVGGGERGRGGVVRGEEGDLDGRLEAWYFDAVARKIGMSWDGFEIWWRDVRCTEEGEDSALNGE